MAALDLGPGGPQPSRGVLGRGAAGLKLLALLPARRAGAAPPLRRGRPGPARRRRGHRPAAEQDLGPLALPAEGGRAPRRPLLRLLGRRRRATAVPTGMLRPGQDPPRSRTRRDVFFPPAFDRAGGTRPGSNAGKAPLGVLAEPRGVRLGRGPAAPAPVGHHHLRAARPRVHEQPELRRRPRAARHLCREWSRRSRT